ncbi:MAG: di-heme oxidoredictase family protein, partial [Puniceicoccales bacterium]
MARLILLFMALTLVSTAHSARLEFLPGAHRIHWDADEGVVYLIEQSDDLREWQAVGPIFVGADEARHFDAALGDSSNRFYRLLQVPAGNVVGSPTDGQRPAYLAWASEQPDGSVRMEFYALQETDFADVHYRINGDDQLNYRLDGDGPRWYLDTPPLNADDTLTFYFTYDDDGSARDTATATYTVGEGGNGNPGGGDNGGGGTSYEDVLPEPNTAADYTHGITFANGQATLRIRPGVHPDNMLVNYQRNDGNRGAYQMTKNGDEWQYSFTAEDGDEITYAFHSVDPNHVRSADFFRTIGEARADREEPLIILAAGRFRDRHENELRFDSFVENYFDFSYFGLTIHDYGDAVDVVFDPAEPMNFVDIKLFDRDTRPHEERPLGERADFAQAIRMFPVDGKFYWRADNLEPGQFVDLEFTLQRTRTGQQYYTAIFRFYLGDGALVQRVEAAEAQSGGATTVDVYAETEYSYAQAAHNALPNTLRDFLDGKNIFDREFTAEDGLGPLYNGRSCFECHVNDGSARPPENFGDMLEGMVFHLAEPVTGGGQQPHPDYGVQLQDRAIDGSFPEGRGQVSYTEVPGQFDDGQSYSLAQPTYTFSGLQGPTFRTAVTSPRVAPKIIGLGLLEAISPATIEA